MKYANEISALFNAYWDTTETSSIFMRHYEDMAQQTRRPMFNTVLRNILEQHPNITGAWCVWEPDTLEGNDALYARIEGSSASGRFVPYWYRTAKGEIKLDLLENAYTSNYYLLSRSSHKLLLLEPYLLNAGGSSNLMTSITAPIISHGRTVGVIGVNITLDTIQGIYNNNEAPFGTGFTAVFSNESIVVAHFDPERIGKHMRDTEQDMNGIYMDEIIAAVRNSEVYAFSNYIKPIETQVNAIFSPIKVGDAPAWSYAVAIPHRTVIAPVYQMMYLSIFIIAIVIAIVILAAFFLSRSISQPIMTLTETLKDIAEGEGDLTKTIEIKSKDEIGSLARYFNDTLEKIKNLVLKIKNEAAGLSDIGYDLVDHMDKTSTAINKITANIQNVNTRTLNQSASVSQTHATMEHVVTNINKLNEHVEVQSRSLASASASIEEMVANINSVTQTLINNASNVKTLQEASEVGRSGLQDVSADIQEIARESEGLMEINSVMQNIASQTNLLSMNAAIEAAHAGESGRGFAVVADEIRKLAENSSIQSKTIGVVLKKIKGAIDKITVSTENVMNKFEAIDSSIQTVALQEDNIRNAMEEQGVGSKKILEGISNVNEITRHVNESSTAMHEGAQEVIQESTNLEKSTQEITSGMHEMASGAEQINIAVTQVNEVSNKNREAIDVLIKEVSRFKVA
jgi:methyl-accepting chemotaxis protein